jgi:uncharacterized protein involved in high-affinity Fe2+ transport
VIKVASRLSLAGACLLSAACVVRTATNLDDGFEPTAHGRSTSALMPTWEPSNEASQPQLRLARDQGDAAAAEVRWLLRNTLAAEMPAGEYHIAYAFTAPKGWWAPEDSGLAWHDPSGNAHLAVYVRDGADGRPVPGLTVRTTLLDPAGRPADARELPFGWDAFMNEYGDNLSLPGAGTYTLRIRVDPPDYWRHDPVNGDRYTDSAVAEFTDVRLDPAAIARVRAEPGPRQLARAQAEGATVQRAYYHMASSTATDGAQVRSGDYILAYADEFAEGYWYNEGKQLVYDTRVEASTEHNAHIEVAVLDALTGRFMPGLRVHATVLDPKGAEHGSHDVPFMWHPWLYHYGRNWLVPKSRKDYVLRVHVDPPAYRRYGRELGRRFAAPIDFEFPDVMIRTGVK